MGEALIMKKQRIICLIVFILYILIILYITILRFNFRYDERQLNLSLFTNLIRVFRKVGVGEFLRLFLGNIVWFVPFGFLLPILSKRKSLIFTTAIGLVFSFIIETIQFIFYKGVAELDDLILNVLGTAIGYALYKIVRQGDRFTVLTCLERQRTCHLSFYLFSRSQYIFREPASMDSANHLDSQWLWHQSILLFHSSYS